MRKFEHYKKPELLHDVKIPDKFFEYPKIMNSILSVEEKNIIYNILENFNYFRKNCYNGNISKRKFWENKIPEFVDKLFEDFERFKNVYGTNFAGYLLKGLFHIDREKNNKKYFTFNRNFESLEDMVENITYTEVICSSNPNLKKYNFSPIIDFDPKKLSEVIFCYYAKIRKRPLCPVCNKNELEFRDLVCGYREFCSPKCQITYHNLPKEKKLSDKSNDEIRELISQIPLDARTTTNEKIMNHFLNIEKNYPGEELSEREKLYLFMNKKDIQECYCICGRKKIFLSQGQGYKKTCGNTFCLITRRGGIPKKDISDYKDTNYHGDRNNCFLYILKSEKNNFFKVGISHSPINRLRNLQKYIPDFEIIFSMYLKRAEYEEQNILKKYKHKKIRLDYIFPGSSELLNLNSKDLKEIKNNLFRISNEE